MGIRSRRCQAQAGAARGGGILYYYYADHRDLLADHALDIARLAPIANHDAAFAAGIHVMAAKLSALIVELFAGRL